MDIIKAETRSETDIHRANLALALLPHKVVIVDFEWIVGCNQPRHTEQIQPHIPVEDLEWSACSLHIQHVTSTKRRLFCDWYCWS